MVATTNKDSKSGSYSASSLPLLVNFYWLAFPECFLITMYLAKFTTGNVVLMEDSKSAVGI